MAQHSSTKALGSIKLSYEEPLSAEYLQEIEDMVTQAGLQIQDSRRYITQLPDSTSHVVEIIASYDDLTLDQWSDLTGVIAETYCWPIALGNKGYDMRKRI
jgi:hypothetical protein